MTWDELKDAIDAEPRMADKVRLQEEWNLANNSRTTQQE